MDYQASQSDVLCANGYYGFQPVLNCSSGGCPDTGTSSLSNGHCSHAEWNGSASPSWQRKRNRDIFVNGDTAAELVPHNGTEAKRLCPDLYHSKLQQAMAISSNGASTNTQGMPTDNGVDGISIGTDSAMMMTDECSEMEVAGCQMSTESGVEPAHTNGNSGHGVTTVGASVAPRHTCYTSRTQLCTMSFQQSYVLSSSRDCPRCMAGEPVPYLSISQTVENLSKLY